MGSARENLGRLVGVGFMLTALVGAARGLGPVQVDSGPPSPTQTEGAEREALRRRWESMSEGERALMRRRFESFRSMSPDARRQLEGRVRRLAEVEQRVRTEAPPHVRRAAEGLPPFRQREFWRDRVSERERERGHRMRERLPAPLVERLEAAHPAERRHILEEVRREHDWSGDRAARRMGEQLGARPEEVDRWLELPPEERKQRMMAKRRGMLERRAESEGLPPGLTAEEWQRLRAAPDRDFFEAMRNLGLPAAWRRPERGGGAGSRPHRPDGQRFDDPSSPPRRETRKRL